MNRNAICLLVVVVTAMPLTAQPLGKEKLRAAAYLPKVAVFIGMSSLEQAKRDPDGRRTDPAAKIAELRKRLRGTVEDAEVYLQIADCCDFSIDRANAFEAASKAEALLRPHLEAPGAKAGRLLAAYCWALAILRPDDSASWAIWVKVWPSLRAVAASLPAGDLVDRERWARQATLLAPGEWRCWEQLGWAWSNRLDRILYGPTGKPEGDLNDVLTELLRRKPPAEALTEAEKCLREARHCFDKVRTLAPREPEALQACVAFGWSEVAGMQLLASLRGQGKLDWPFRDLAVVQDSLALANLCPENMPHQAMAAIMELAVVKEKASTSGNAQQRPRNNAAGEAPLDWKPVQKYLDRLAKGAASPNAEAAAFCHMHLASMYYGPLDDAKPAEAHARRALELDGNLQEMWELLESSLHEQGQKDELLKVAQACLKRLPTARNYFLLAKTLADRGRLVEAEQALRDGLRKDSLDLYCDVGLAAVLIRRSHQANTLPEANRRLERIQAMLTLCELRPHPSADLVRDFHVLRIICAGLIGRPEIGRELLHHLIAQTGEAPELREVRAALGTETPKPIPGSQQSSSPDRGRRGFEPQPGR